MQKTNFNYVSYPYERWSWQLKKVEEVATAVYRPCCGNSPLFPDCNRGMAMLGLLELMAS